MSLTGWSSVAAGHRRALLLIWAIFLVRAGFYLSFTPLWEGFDEHAHFAYIQLMAVEGRLPVADKDRISQEVYSSLKQAPLPWQPGGFGIGLTHDQYWKLDEADRRRLEAGLRALDPSLGRTEIAADQTNPFLFQYERQHPPLYYALCLTPYRLVDRLNLIDRVFLIRAVSILIASGLIPAGFFLVRRFFGDTEALLVIWVITLLPGLMFDVVRVGNESLAVLLFTVLLCLSVRGATSRKRALMIGLVLGLGLLTKSSFLTAVIPVGLGLLLPLDTSRSLKTRFGDVGLVGLVAVVLSGWWYALNYWTSGSWTGLYFDSAVQGSSLPKAALSVDWWNAFKTILSSHVWFGNWSFLKLRGWVYQFVIIAVLLGMTGAAMRVARDFVRQKADRYAFLVAVMFYAFFWLGLGYHVLLTYVATGISATAGWYLYTVIACEMLVLMAGWTFLSRSGVTRIAGIAALGAVLIDLYGLSFVLIPYYTGFISHDAGGSLSSFKPWTLSLADYLEMISRLTANKPGFMTRGYFLGSALLLVLTAIGSVGLAVCLLLQGGLRRGRWFKFVDK
ncbi:MAG: hypothetical protein EHM18_04490 [Acidobacteria bacterium]|nr:MAG: hypothetical protein EHM18_04490 [Acidobacteriota bacterium]